MVDDSLLPACFMTVPKVLKAIVALPDGSRTHRDLSMIESMVKLLKKYRLYEYVARDSSDWQTWAHTATAA